MSASAPTKIFGMRVGIDPKILVGALIAVAALLFWFNSRSDTDTSTSPANSTRAQVAAPSEPVTPVRRVASQRRRAGREDRGTLKFRAVDPTHGDVDPLLRLDLLSRLANVQAISGVRNLFEIGPSEAERAQAAIVPVRRIVPGPEIHAPPVAAFPGTIQTAVNIPLKYYGFEKPSNPGDPNKGFFMNGDDVFVAAEGQLLQQRYLVVQLTPMSARLEDTQVKMGQTISVLPEATEQ